jgi:hypothetical protein
VVISFPNVEHAAAGASVQAAAPGLLQARVIAAARSTPRREPRRLCRRGFDSSRL